MTSWYVKCSMMATARSWRFHGVACGDRKVQSIQQHHRLHDLMRELGSLDFDKAFLSSSLVTCLLILLQADEVRLASLSSFLGACANLPFTCFFCSLQTVAIGTRSSEVWKHVMHERLDKGHVAATSNCSAPPPPPTPTHTVFGFAAETW